MIGKIVDYDGHGKRWVVEIDISQPLSLYSAAAPAQGNEDEDVNTKVGSKKDKEGNKGKKKNIV